METKKNPRFSISSIPNSTILTIYPIYVVATVNLYSMYNLLHISITKFFIKVPRRAS